MLGQQLKAVDLLVRDFCPEKGKGGHSLRILEKSQFSDNKTNVGLIWEGKYKFGHILTKNVKRKQIENFVKML